jgi:hypothetical protein
MRTIAAFAAALISSTAVAADAPAAPPPPPSCDGPEFHQMDFWLGDWNLTWEGGKGTNHVVKEFAGCVVHENFRDTAHGPPPPLVGQSFSVYHALNKMWRQTWVDNQDGYFDLTGGPQQDGTFMLQVIRVGREPHMMRMVYQDIRKGSFTWRWQMSDDGDTWTDKWVIHYTRAK